MSTTAPNHLDLRTAYFSMEVGLRSDLPTYSGGLGVLAGDTIRSAADLELPFVAVSLVHRKGYFRQSLGEDGVQREQADPWDPAEELLEVGPRVRITIEGRPVLIRAWEFRVEGVTGHEVPVLLLDTDLEENTEEDRRITDSLYGGDQRYRLMQETVLGLGGVELLNALQADGLETYHMNEGHSALLSLALMEDELEGIAGEPAAVDIAEGLAAVRARTVFTTHTPVPAGHDQFELDLVRTVLGERRAALLEAAECVMDDGVNLTHVALQFSRFTNGVAARHGAVSRKLFPGAEIHAITNGVHAATWTGDGFRALFDRHLPGWRNDPFLLRQAITIPLEEFRSAHRLSKEALLEHVQRRTGVELSADRFTIAFARRATPYKRADLLMADPGRLAAMSREVGGLQILYAGKAHPRDAKGKEMIQRIILAGAEAGAGVEVVYLENYDMELGRLLTSGADLWLNNPRKPLEASGTSGMKAALNGVPCLSVLDGWWIEGHAEGLTGWSIDEDWRDESDSDQEAEALLEKLESVVLPLFHDDPEGWARVMRGAVAFNGSHFHTRRMMLEYLALAYPHRAVPEESELAGAAG